MQLVNIQVSVAVLPNTANQTIQYTTSNSAVASVDSEGKVTGLSTGETEITVTSEDGTKSEKVAITVVKTSVVYQSHIQILVGKMLRQMARCQVRKGNPCVLRE